MMEKWTAPKTVVEQFVANEYVAACTESEMVYKFKCNAGWEFFGYHVWDEKDGYMGLYSPCDKEHEAKVTDEFHEGYMFAAFPPIPAGRVIIWRGEDGNNVHCTRNLRIEDWPIARS